TSTARFRNVSVDSIAVLPCTPGSAEAVHEAAFFQEVLLAVLAGIARTVRDDAAAGARVRERTFNTGLVLPYRPYPLIQATVGRIAANASADEATTCMLLPPWTAHLMPPSPPEQSVQNTTANYRLRCLRPRSRLNRHKSPCPRRRCAWPPSYF